MKEASFLYPHLSPPWFIVSPALVHRRLLWIVWDSICDSRCSRERFDEREHRSSYTWWTFKCSSWSYSGYRYITLSCDGSLRYLEHWYSIRPSSPPRGQSFWSPYCAPFPCSYVAWVPIHFYWTIPSRTAPPQFIHSFFVLHLTLKSFLKSWERIL